MTWGHHINLRRAEISIFALSLSLILLLVQAGIATGGVDPLGEELKTLDVRGLLLPLAVVALIIFNVYGLFTGHTQEYRKYHHKTVLAILALVGQFLLLAAFIMTVRAMALDHKTGPVDGSDWAIVVLQGCTIVLTCVVWFLVHWG